MNFFEFLRLQIVDDGSLLISNVTSEDEGKYQCVAKNVAAMRGSQKATLTLLGELDVLMVRIALW